MRAFPRYPRSLPLTIDRLNGRRTLRRLDTEDTFMVPTLPTLLAARRPSQTVTRALCSQLPQAHRGHTKENIEIGLSTISVFEKQVGMHAHIILEICY